MKIRSMVECTAHSTESSLDQQCCRYSMKKQTNPTSWELAETRICRGNHCNHCRPSEMLSRNHTALTTDVS